MLKFFFVRVKILQWYDKKMLFKSNIVIKYLNIFLYSFLDIFIIYFYFCKYLEFV